MPEDTRVQQQVHMHIWMEADIIMVIVSDACQGCQGERSICLDANFKCKESKNPRSATRGFRPGSLELRAIREVRCHPAEDHTHLDP
jgi:hypothetical protein